MHTRMNECSDETGNPRIIAVFVDCKNVFCFYFSNLEFMKDWPIHLLVEHPEHCLLHFYK